MRTLKEIELFRAYGRLEESMTQENRNLLLIDLLGRLPYGVKVLISLDIRRELGLDIIHNFIYNNVCGVRPYLRPMSDMTEEERRELGKIPAITEYIDETQPNVPNYIEVARPEQLDWLNAHHFDYRELIPKGLAIEVTKDSSPYE